MESGGRAGEKRKRKSGEEQKNNLLITDNL